MGVIQWSLGACWGMSVEESEEIFFPKPGRPKKIPPWETHCSDCPIQYTCLSYAIVHDEVGVWGNTTDQEREILQDRVVAYEEGTDRPISLKEHLTQEAKNSGWWEDRSVDLFPAENRATEEEFLAPLEELESPLDLAPLPEPEYFQPKFVQQTPQEPYEPLGLPPAVFPHPNSGNGQSEDSKQSPLDLAPLPDIDLSSNLRLCNA